MEVVFFIVVIGVALLAVCACAGNKIDDWERRDGR